jgi:hypothetical protein
MRGLRGWKIFFVILMMVDRHDERVHVTRRVASSARGLVVREHVPCDGWHTLSRQALRKRSRPTRTLRRCCFDYSLDQILGVTERRERWKGMK